MSLKLKLIVICVVIFQFGECSECNDYLKCVWAWARTALSSSEHNLKARHILNSTKLPTVSKSLTNDVLTNLTHLLEGNLNLKRSGPAKNTQLNDTDIGVQVFDILDNTTESTSLIILEETEHNKYSKALNAFPYNASDKIKTSAGNQNKTQDFNPATLMAKRNKMVLDYMDSKNTVSNDTETTTEKHKTSSIILEYSNSKTTEKESTITTKKVMKKNYTNYTNKDSNESKIIIQTNKINNSITTATKRTTVAVKSDLTQKNTPSFYDYNDIYDISTTVVPAPEVKPVETENYKYTNIQNVDENTGFQHNTHDISNIPEKVNIKDNIIDDFNVFFDERNDFEFVDLLKDNITDYLDINYVDIYKDTTNEDVEYISTVYTPSTTETTNTILNKKPTDRIDDVYPWIAAVFVMDPDRKQFEYICDGSLLSKRIVLTAARCVIKEKVPDPANFLIFLGKRSLQSRGPNEIVVRVKSIKIHHGFQSSKGLVENDLAIVLLDEEVEFNNDIKPAVLEEQEKTTSYAIATTGWHVTGELQPLYLTKQENCQNNLFCAKLDDLETTCPSFGGLLLSEEDINQWRLKGIASGMPKNSGACFEKNLIFTKIEYYFDWIMKIMEQEALNDEK